MSSARIEPEEEGWPAGLKPPPRGRDLPYDDGEPMETINHRWQMNLLIEVFTWAINREDAFVGGNHALYYSALQAKRNDFKAPDVFVVLDAIDNPERLSWVVWEEDGRTPNVVIELLSQSTERSDRGNKKRIYEQILKVPDYFIYDPVDFRFEGWRLDNGVYRPLVPDAHGRLFCHEVGLWLGRSQGEYIKRRSTWLRLFDAEGQLVPTFTEAAVEQAKVSIGQANADVKQAKAALEQGRAAAKAEVERAKAEVEQAKAEAEQAKAALEQARAEASIALEQARAEVERAADAEARLAELRAELSRY